MIPVTPGHEDQLANRLAKLLAGAFHWEQSFAKDQMLDIVQDLRGKCSDNQFVRILNASDQELINIMTVAMQNYKAAGFPIRKKSHDETQT
jgi:hypothetical protein